MQKRLRGALLLLWACLFGSLAYAFSTWSSVRPDEDILHAGIAGALGARSNVIGRCVAIAVFVFLWFASYAPFEFVSAKYGNRPLLAIPALLVATALYVVIWGIPYGSSAIWLGIVMLLHGGNAALGNQILGFWTRRPSGQPNNHAEKPEA